MSPMPIARIPIEYIAMTAILIVAGPLIIPKIPAAIPAATRIPIRILSLSEYSPVRGFMPFYFLLSGNRRSRGIARRSVSNKSGILTIAMTNGVATIAKTLASAIRKKFISVTRPATAMDDQTSPEATASIVAASKSPNAIALGHWPLYASMMGFTGQKRPTRIACKGVGLNAHMRLSTAGAPRSLSTDTIPHMTYPAMTEARNSIAELIASRMRYFAFASTCSIA